MSRCSVSYTEGHLTNYSTDKQDYPAQDSAGCMVFCRGARAAGHLQPAHRLCQLSGRRQKQSEGGFSGSQGRSVLVGHTKRNSHSSAGTANKHQYVQTPTDPFVRVPKGLAYHHALTMICSQQICNHSCTSMLDPSVLPMCKKCHICTHSCKEQTQHS